MFEANYNTINRVHYGLAIYIIFFQNFKRICFSLHQKGQTMEIERRDLVFDSYEDTIEEIRSLQKGGYEKMGAWSLGQICAHMSFYYKGSLEGFGFSLPWIVRVLFGKPYMKKRMKGVRLKAGSSTAPKSLPPDDLDETEAIEKAIAFLEQLPSAEKLHPSPLLGELTVEEWRIMHLGHTAHHLGFLSPKS